jgi:hypothetical protein
MDLENLPKLPADFIQGFRDCWQYPCLMSSYFICFQTPGNRDFSLVVVYKAICPALQQLPTAKKR